MVEAEENCKILWLFVEACTSARFLPPDPLLYTILFHETLKGGEAIRLRDRLFRPPAIVYTPLHKSWDPRTIMVICFIRHFHDNFVILIPEALAHTTCPV